MMNKRTRGKQKSLFAILWVAAFLASSLVFVHGRITLAQSGETPNAPQAAAVTAAQSKAFLPIIIKPAAATPLPSDFGDRVIALVNQHRANNGCGALSKNSALTNAALGHSTDMALHDFFSHTGSDGSSTKTRIERAGYNYLGGEKILRRVIPPRKASLPDG